MNTTRPYVLSIAGLDPSAGAGLLADIKTFENIGVYGLGVTSSVTIQNDVEFRSVKWLGAEEIIKQCEPLMEKFRPELVKIGLIESLDTLAKVISWLRSKNKEVKIIWDPILRASSGFDFHTGLDYARLFLILPSVSLLTPNIPEIKKLSGCDTVEESVRFLSVKCPVYLKGGHAEGDDITDLLYVSDRLTEFTNRRIKNGQKHGSGCVLSSAIAAYMALGHSMEEASGKAFAYMTGFLGSNTSLLGYHSGIVHHLPHILNNAR